MHRSWYGSQPHPDRIGMHAELMHEEGEYMKINIGIKKGVSIEDAMNTLVEIATINQRIEADPHTNKHYDLIKGKMWMRGDGTGKYWELLCNSREAHRDSREIFGLS